MFACWAAAGAARPKAKAIRIRRMEVPLRGLHNVIPAEAGISSPWRARVQQGRRAIPLIKCGCPPDIRSPVRGTGRLHQFRRVTQQAAGSLFLEALPGGLELLEEALRGRT